MALSLSVDANDDDTLGARTLSRTGRAVGDTSYPAGGYPNIKQQFGLIEIRALMFNALTTAAQAYRPRYDPTNDKLMIHNSAGAEIAGAANVSDFDFRIVAIGCC